MKFDDWGMLEGATSIPSPNCDDRPAGVAVMLVVIHNISLPPGEFGGDAIVDLFTNRLDCSAHPFFETLSGLRVSTHFLIRRGGEVLQFVPCDKRAWHAGRSSHAGREDCNDFSVGIELEGTDDTVYTDRQYQSLVHLAVALGERYPIRDIVGHSDIASGRKTDPGVAFDWVRFRKMLARQ